MNPFIYQIKQAWAGLANKPGFIATVLTTMSLTLGALLCVLTLAYLMLLQPMPYPDQDKLYRVGHDLIDSKGKANARAFTYPTLVHLYDKQETFTEAAMIKYERDVLLSDPKRPVLSIAFTSPEFFTLLDVPMALGRPLEQTEGRGKRNMVAVISYQSWQSQFGGDSDILGQKVSFSGLSFRIVGVTGADFVEPQIHQRGLLTDVWLPWELNFSDEVRRSNFGTVERQAQFIGRLAGGISVSQAEQTLTPMISEYWQADTKSHPFFKGWRIGIELEPFKTVILGDSEKTVYLLLAGVFGLVLLACANLLNLFMSRTAEQQRQLAVHAAVGAKRGDLFRALFFEAGLLMGLSVIIALVIAAGGFAIMQQYLADVLPRVEELSINHITLGAAMLIALILAYGFSRLSLGMINYRAINVTLQSSGKGSGIQVSKRVRKALIISQIAIVTSLVFVNMSLFKEAMQTITKPLEVKIDDTMQLDLSISTTTAPTSEQTRAILEQVLGQLEQLPEVESAHVGYSPLTRFGTWVATVIETSERLIVRGQTIGPKYFEVFGQTLLEGDTLTQADVRDNNKVVVINDVMAKKLAPKGSAIGLLLNTGWPTPTRVIGVVKGVMLPGETEIPERMYAPNQSGDTSIVLRLKPGQTLSHEQAVVALKAATSEMAVFNLQTLHESYDQILFTQYATAVTTAALTLLSFFLAAVGLYGIFSYSTQLRRFELGTRLAIGAKRKDLVGLIVKDNTSPVIVGIVISAMLLLALYVGFSASLADYINTNLVVMYVVTLGLIGLVSLAACYLPLSKIINRQVIHSLRNSE